MNLATAPRRGKVFPVEITAKFFEYDGREYHCSFARDITERKRAAEALRESEERYRELFEHINCGVAVYEVIGNGEDFVFKDFNRAGEKIDHDRRERLIGKSIFEVRPGVEQFGLIETFRQVWRTGEPAHHPVTLYQDGRLDGWYENFIYRLGSGEIVAVFENVTERKLAEEQLHASREQLRALTARLQAVREEERTSVAREIHEVLAQELTRLKIDIVWLQHRLANPGMAAASEALATRVYEMAAITDAAIQSIQKIATALRPAVLDGLGLCGAVEWLARDFRAYSGIECHADVPEAELPVERGVATVAFRILQESLTNVRRHAKATRVDILLRRDADRLDLRIEDDGCGIRPEILNSPTSIGLAGMREQAQFLGGQFEIRRRPGSGTTVEAQFPLSKNEKS